MSNYQCSCYWEYPNPMHRHNNGKWKCIDNYEKCEDWQPKSIYSCKTHCRRKEVKMNEIKVSKQEILTILKQLKEENMYNQFKYSAYEEAIKRVEKLGEKE